MRIKWWDNRVQRGIVGVGKSSSSVGVGELKVGSRV